MTATANGQTQIDLSWTAPSDNGGANITGYKIEVSTNGSTWSDLESNTGSTGTSYSHTGLTAGSTRHYRVSAINSAGPGTPSSTANATTDPAVAAPGAPTGFTVTADGQTRIDLSWSAPSSDGGANITGYKVEVSTNGSTWSDLVANTNATSTTYTHTGLMAGSTRHYRVSAINSAGTGPASNTDSATTDAGAAPDLVVDALRASDSRPTAGASFTLNATVNNQGNGTADSTTLRYHRSTDSTITTGDTEVGTDSVSRLNPSGSSDESISLTALSTPGTYYYGACVDSVSGESDTTNNCSSAVTVTVSSSSSGDTYGVGDFLPGVPTTGLFVPAVTVGASLSSSSGNTTITFTNGGYIELQDGTRYTCQSTGGCGVHNGEVTQGTIVSQTTSVTSDLMVDPPTVSESAPAAGASFTLNATVRNQGDGSSSSTTLRYYRSTDTAITAGDTEVGTDPVSGLSSTGSSDESISVTAPADAGTYYYGACVDSVSGESDTTNNCSVTVTVAVGAAPAPDLVVDTPTVSNSSPTAGASFTLNATVRNQGDGSSAATTLYYWRATVTESSVGGFYEVGTDTVDTLAASGASNMSISLTAPATPGMYDFYVSINPVPGESNSGNNYSDVVKITVLAATTSPDLVVRSPTIDNTNPAAGASFTLSATVRNKGDGYANSTTLRYYRSTDSTISSSDTSLGTDSVSSLNVAGTSAQSISLAAPSLAGTYYYGACVDTVSGESDTQNNCSASVQVTVTAPTPAPDLTFRHFSAEGFTTGRNPKVAGASFHLYAQVHNIGTDASTATTLRYYRSTDSTITASDTEVGMDSVIALPSGRGLLATSNISVTAPDTPGIYYYGACVDSVSNESDTTNNCSTAVEIAVLAPPDLVVDTPEVGGRFGQSTVTLSHGQTFNSTLSCVTRAMTWATRPRCTTTSPPMRRSQHLIQFLAQNDTPLGLHHRV